MKKFGFKSSISEIENGNAPITERTIISICSVYGVNEKWLRYGKGDIYTDHSNKYNEFIQIYNNLDEPLQNYLYKLTLDRINH